MLEWASAGWLWALLALLPLAVLVGNRVADGLRRRRAFAPSGLWVRMRRAGDEPETVARAAVVLAALVLVVLALADPRAAGSSGGGRAREEAPRLVVLLDVSKSMLAADASYGGMAGTQDRATAAGGTRFDAAKALTRDLLGTLRGWQVGIVVFAGEPLVLCAITPDLAAAQIMLERARAGDPGVRGGSNLEGALRAGQALLGKGRGSLLLISDGEELAGKAADAAGSLAARRIPVHVVGVGTAERVPMRLESGETVSWRGETVLTARNDAILAGIARRTGGRYWAAAASSGGMAAPPPGALVAGGLDTPAGRRQTGESRRTGIVLGALALLALDAAWGARRQFRRAGRGMLALWLGGPDRAPARKAAALALVPLVVAGWTWPAVPYVQRALDAYRQGDASRSVTLFEEAARRDPDPALRYDLGNALHLAGDYRRSARVFEEALRKLPAGGRLSAHAHYNLGNTRFRLGDFRAAMDSYRKALAIDPRDEDARHNLALAEAQLARESRPVRAPGRPAARQERPGVVPMPGADEAEALLARLEEDERQRQAEAARQDRGPEQAAETPSQLARRLLREAEQSVTRQLEKDW